MNATAKKYFGSIFEVGADLYGWMTAQSAWRKNCAEMAPLLPAGDSLRIIDLGCGPGVSAFELARLRPGSKVIGFDIASRMLAQARRRQKGSGISENQLAWTRGDVHALPFRDASVDALTGHSFLYLVPDRHQALEQMHRVLRPGGRLVLMEPNQREVPFKNIVAVSRDPRFLLSMSLWRPVSRLQGRFNPDSLRAILAEHGFVDVSVREILGGLGLLASALRP